MLSVSPMIPALVPTREMAPATPARNVPTRVAPTLDLVPMALVSVVLVSV